MREERGHCAQQLGSTGLPHPDSLGFCIPRQASTHPRALGGMQVAPRDGGDQVCLTKAGEVLRPSGFSKIVTLAKLCCWYLEK